MDADWKETPIMFVQYLATVERELLMDAIARNRGNHTRAATDLGLTYRAFRYRAEKLGIKEHSSEPSGRTLGKFWPKLRMDALRKYGNRCQCCGASPKTGATIEVDHIKPRHSFPELELNLDNLQVLCSACHESKGLADCTDWR